MARELDASAPANGTCRSEVTPLGNARIKTVRGAVSAVEVPAFCTMTVDVEGKPASVMVLLYDPPTLPDVGEGVGVFSQMDAAAAREMGASLIRLADRLEPRSPH